MAIYSVFFFSILAHSAFGRHSRLPSLKRSLTSLSWSLSSLLLFIRSSHRHRYFQHTHDKIVYLDGDKQHGKMYMQSNAPPVISATSTEVDKNVFSRGDRGG